MVDGSRIVSGSLCDHDLVCKSFNINLAYKIDYNTSFFSDNFHLHAPPVLTPPNIRFYRWVLSFPRIFTHFVQNRWLINAFFYIQIIFFHFFPHFEWVDVCARLCLCTCIIKQNVNFFDSFLIYLIFLAIFSYVSSISTKPSLIRANFRFLSFFTCFCCYFYVIWILQLKKSAKNNINSPTFTWLEEHIDQLYF